MQEGLLGVTAIDRHPRCVSLALDPRLEPVELGRRQFQLGAELPGIEQRQLGQVLAADVEAGQQGQGRGAPDGMLGQASQQHPQVAIDILLAGGSRRGVVVQSDPLDLPTVAGRRRVADGQYQAAVADQAGPSDQPGVDGQQLGAASDGIDGVVGGSEVIADADGSEPGGGGASACGQQDAQQQQRHPESGTAVEPAGQAVKNGGQPGAGVRQWHGPVPRKHDVAW